MDQVHVIRHKVLLEGKSVRSVAKEMGVSCNTVAKYLKNPEPRRTVARRRMIESFTAYSPGQR